MRRELVLGICLSALAASCASPPPSKDAQTDVDANGATAATSITRDAIAKDVRDLPLGDQQDFEDAQRGRVAGDPDVLITDAAGKTIWDTRSYAFVTGDPPPSVNPSLWRQAKLNGFHG